MRFLRRSFVIFVALMGLFLAGCASAETMTVETAGSLQQDASTPAHLYPDQDLSLVGSTGRFQFLNVYADW
jgi:hypothetical protein